MAKMSRKDYAQMYGPTVGDAIRLGDTSLFAEVEHDFAVPGEECLHGGGKTLRDGLGLTPGYDSAMGALDMLLCNALVIDPVLGIVKGDIGIKDGRIVGIGKAGNPATMDGVHPEPDRRRGDHGARCRGHDRHAGRHRRACAFRLCPALRACHQFGHHHHDRRLARPDHRRHRLRRRLQCRQDAAGRRALADQFRLPRPGQHLTAALDPRPDERRLHRPEDSRGLGRDAGGDRHLSCGRRRARLPGAAPHRHAERERLPRGYAGRDPRPHHPHVSHRGRGRRARAGHHPRGRERSTACRRRPTRPIPTPSTPSTSTST